MTEKMTKKKVRTRRVYYCPLCGWESFDKGARGSACGQTDCKGYLTGSHKESYEV